MIQVEELTKDFGSFRAVDHLSFEVGEGEILGFLGPNGAGKTTTIRVLTGFHPATSGRVRIRGKDLLTHSLEIRAGLGYLPENVPLYPDLRVGEYLRFRAGLKGIPRKERKARVEEAMEKAGVTEMRRKLVGHVSRGYRQRVGLADALISHPPLLVFDEPTSGLDPNQRRKVRELIRGLRGRHTILFSSHILTDVEAVCDRIVLIHRGRKRADGPLEALSLVQGRREIRLWIRAPEEELPPLFEGLPLGEPRIEKDGDWRRLVAGLPPEAELSETLLLDRLCSRIREKGFGLRELHLHRPTLEELFHQLTELADEAEEETGT